MFRLDVFLGLETEHLREFFFSKSPWMYKACISKIRHRTSVEKGRQ